MTRDELKRKKYVRLKDGAELYGVSKTTFSKMADEAGAKRKVNGLVLINVEKLDEYIEAFEVPSY